MADWTDKLTRVSLIDAEGLVWQRYDLESVVLLVQDEGRTLKVVVNRPHWRVISDGRAEDTWSNEGGS